MSKLLYLQSNSKLRDSSTFTYAFNLPAVATCPGAGICKEYCFALAEQRRYPSVMAYRQRSLELSKSEEFIPTILKELDIVRRWHWDYGTQFAVRIHASGDFYSPEYVRKWLTIIEIRPDVRFYAYTKSITIWKRLDATYRLPTNLTLIYSMGSTADIKVDTAIDRHARIFQTEEDAIASGYTLANEDDTVAWQSDNNKIGLVIFGATNKFKQLTGESNATK